MATIAVTFKISENKYTILTMPEFIKVFDIIGGFSEELCKEQFMDCNDEATYTIADIVDMLMQKEDKKELFELKAKQKKLIDEPYAYNYGQVVMCREAEDDDWFPVFYLGASVIDGKLFHNCVAPDYVESYMEADLFLANTYTHVRKVYCVDQDIASLYYDLEIGTSHKDYLYRLMYEFIKESTYGI